MFYFGWSGIKQLTIREEAELTSKINKCSAIVCMFEIEDGIFQDKMEYIFLVVLN